MRKIFSILKKIPAIAILALVIYVLLNSALDIYNNFAYDKAIVRESPYGFIPMLDNPANYTIANDQIKSGDFVYVEDWISGNNGRVIFAKVKSKLNEGYINRELLTQTNINVKPIISVLLLILILFLFIRKIFIHIQRYKFHRSFNKFHPEYTKYQVH